MRERILYYAIKYQGDFKRVSKAIIQQEEYEKIEYKGKYITIMDKEYPEKLLRLKYKPWILFYEGNINLLNKEMVSVVGSRVMSEYGKKCCELLVKNLNAHKGIVSGLAKGIDACIHKQALLHNFSTIGVLGCGIDVIYPKENQTIYSLIKKHGLIISEYPQGVKPLAHHFPWRNRILVALSESLVVIEAKQRSGSFISVNEALEIELPIYCFPHPINSELGEGCNLLIEQGCNIIVSEKDIKEI